MTPRVSIEKIFHSNCSQRLKFEINFYDHSNKIEISYFYNFLAVSDSGLGRFRPGQFSDNDQGSFRDERFGENVWDDASRGKNKKNKQNSWQNPWADNNGGSNNGGNQWTDGGSNMGGNQWTDGGSNNGGNQEPV